MTFFINPELPLTYIMKELNNKLSFMLNAFAHTLILKLRCRHFVSLNKSQILLLKLMMHFTHSCLLPFWKKCAWKYLCFYLILKTYTNIIRSFMRCQSFFEHSVFKNSDHWNIFYFVMFNKKVTLPPTHFALKYYPAILYLQDIGVWEK